MISSGPIGSLSWLLPPHGLFLYNFSVHRKIDYFAIHNYSYKFPILLASWAAANWLRFQLNRMLNGFLPDVYNNDIWMYIFLIIFFIRYHITVYCLLSVHENRRFENQILNAPPWFDVCDKSVCCINNLIAKFVDWHCDDEQSVTPIELTYTTTST